METDIKLRGCNSPVAFRGPVPLVPSAAGRLNAVLRMIRVRELLPFPVYDVEEDHHVRLVVSMILDEES